MARGDPDAADDESPRMSSWQRFTASVSNMMLKPAPADKVSEDKPSKEQPTTIPELEAAIKRADDKERVIGLLAAPIAAAIALLVVAALVAHDPAAHYTNGQIDKLHVNPSLYSELGAVTLALALLMLGAAWFRKRILIGISMALYGLSIFNLHYWGFGFPFIIGGSWYLVRAYRLSEKLKHARAGQSPVLPATAWLARDPSRQSATPRLRHRFGGRRSQSRARNSKRADTGGRSSDRPLQSRGHRNESAGGVPSRIQPACRVFASVHTLVTRM